MQNLAGFMASIPRSAVTRPQQQVPQWLFAFDAAVMASFRALALLDSHPGQAARVLLLTSAMLAALLDGHALSLPAEWRLDPARLPGTLDNYALRFAVSGTAWSRRVVLGASPAPPTTRSTIGCMTAAQAGAGRAVGLACPSPLDWNTPTSSLNAAAANPLVTHQRYRFPAP